MKSFALITVLSLSTNAFAASAKTFALPSGSTPTPTTPTPNPTTPTPTTPTSARWVGQGSANYNSHGFRSTGGFAMDLIIDDVHATTDSKVSGRVQFLNTLQSVEAGYWNADAQRLTLVVAGDWYANGADILIRGHLADHAVYNAEVYGLIPATADEADHDAMTIALRTEFAIPAEISQDRLIRPIGGATAFAR